MSVPPSNNPPPGGPVYYGQPPGRPAKNNAGCLKAFGITCGVLLLLLVLGGALLVRTWGPLYQQFLKMGQSMVKSQQDGRAIQQAVVAYHAKNGKYPANLTALVADGEISDAGILHSTRTPTPASAISPGATSARRMVLPETRPFWTSPTTLPSPATPSPRIWSSTWTAPAHPAGYAAVQPARKRPLTVSYLLMLRRTDQRINSPLVALRAEWPPSRTKTWPPLCPYPRSFSRRLPSGEFIR